MYETYELSRKEWGIYGAEGILGIAVLDYVFTGMWDFFWY